MSQKSWMKELSSYFESTRKLYPHDPLMIVFDIDGTILDMRHMVFYVLQAFDQAHGTQFFQNLRLSDVTVHENQVDYLLSALKIPSDQQTEILAWYNLNRWSEHYILNAHYPFTGVLDVIRWFQLQPNTFVGLNTGRPESLRSETLKSLNQLGQEYKVQFHDDFLFMNPQTWEEEVKESKILGIQKFQKAGYRIFAMIDNEPSNLQAISTFDLNQEILLLHIDTIFESKRLSLPTHAVQGKTYDLTGLISEKAVPRHIQFVWHGINDTANLRQFLASDITWGECDVHTTPIGDRLILRHDSFTETPLDLNEEWFNLDAFLNRLSQTDKAIKFDLKAGGRLIDHLLNAIETYDFEPSGLWFNGNVERLQEDGFRKLAYAHPGAILQAPIDFLAPLVASAPTKAKEILDLFTSWGINRFSIDWSIQEIRTFFDQMEQWGFEVNIYNVPNLESFLQAVLLMPRSITSDFNFPEWHYYGRGSGQDGIHHHYQEIPSQFSS